MRRTLLIGFLIALALGAFPVLADDPPAVPTGLITEVFPDHPEAPIFLWDDVDTATDYELVIFDQSDVSYDTATVAESGHCVPTLQCAYQQPTAIPPGLYSWSIRAHNGAGYSAYSAAVIFYVSRFAVPGFEAIASPTPIASATPAIESTVQVDTSGMINTLATAEGSLATQPSIASADTSDASLNQSTTSIFGYIKWVLSTRSAEEVFGPFSIFILTVSYALSGLFIIASAFVLFMIAVRLIRLVAWVILAIRKLLPL